MPWAAGHTVRPDSRSSSNRLTNMSADCSEKDLYSALGAEPSDSLQQLKHKYQQLALQYHPDRLTGLCSSEAESGVKRFLEADAAWRILRDQDSRRQYDLQRRAKELQQVWPVDSTVCLDDMTFDPENCVHTHPCRCGGQFTVAEEELWAEPRDRRLGTADEGGGGSSEGETTMAEEVLEGVGSGVVVCCDTCSLSVHVTGSQGC